MGNRAPATVFLPDACFYPKVENVKSIRTLCNWAPPLKAPMSIWTAILGRGCYPSRRHWSF